MVWKCIRDMQFGREGRVPTRVVAISVMRVENLAAHQLNSTSAGEDQGAECEEPI